MDKIKSFISEHRIATSLVAIISVAILLVSISMTVYYSSGAFQLDLSRPEYKPLRSQIDNDHKQDDSFKAQGNIDEKVIDEFLERYKTKSKRIQDSKAFTNDVLSDQQLGLVD